MGALPAEMRKDMLIAEVQAAGPRALAIFEQSLAGGSGVEFAAMCALRQAPGSKNTDRAFCEGQRERMGHMSDVNRKAIEQKLKKKGLDVSNKFHISGLGPVDDPTSWVTCADDVLAVAKAKNLGVEGAVSRPMIDRELKPKNVQLAEPLVKELSQQYLREDPGLAENCRKSAKARAELREKVIGTHGKPARKHK